MNLAIEKTPLYDADVARQFGWHVDAMGEELAGRFFGATEATHDKPARPPDSGRRRKLAHPLLRDLRSSPVERPFQKILIFCRVTETTLQVW